MDRFQEALNNVKRVYVESEHYDEENIRLLQELIDKTTPKKPEQFGNNEYCPKCHYLGHRFYKYCPYCGQALDFGDEDEEI